MPLYMDVHNLDGTVTIDDVAKAHAADLEIQGNYDVSYLRYWVDEAEGKIFCLVEAPDAEAANTVHREAHGLVADEIHPVPGRVLNHLVRRTLAVSCAGRCPVVAAPPPLPTLPAPVPTVDAVSDGRYSTSTSDRHGRRSRTPTHRRIDSDEGGMGIHYVQGDRVGDAEVNLLKPEALIYEPQSDGYMELVAVEYVVFRSAWRQEHPTGRPALLGQHFDLIKGGNRYGIPAFFELHVWAWRHNPSGMFEDWNPRVTCEFAPAT